MSHPSSPIRVLVVDCNVDAAEILSILLGAYGFEAKVECGKEAALKTARNFKPQAVLVDLGKDNLDTFEFALEVRRIAELKDVFLVMLNDRSIAPEFVEANIQFDARLVKPEGYKMLISTLKQKFTIS